MKRLCARTITLLMALLLAAGLSACGPSLTEAPAPTPTPTPTPTPAPTPTPTPTPVVTIYGVFPGEAPAGLGDVFTVLNEKLLQDISTKLELSWVAADKYGESIAAAATGQNLDFFRCDSSELADYAGKRLIAPLDEWMPEYGQDILKNIDGKLFDTMKIGGKLMGVPGAGNTPLAGGGLAFIYREDLRIEYGLPEMAALGNIEQYLGAIKEKDSAIAPLSSGDAALAIMRMLGAESLLGGAGGSVAVSIGADGAATCAPVQDSESFKNAVAKARAWYKAGWLPKDVVSLADPQGKVASGGAAATFGSALSVSSLQEAVSENTPGASLACVPLAGPGARYIEGNGGSALCVASGSKYPDRVVAFWNWVYAAQANYDLVCYGVEGRNYSLSGDGITFIGDSYKGFPSGMFANANYMRFAPDLPKDTIEKIKRWNDGAEASPLGGFVFDGTKVQAELDKAKAVYAAYGKLLFTGSSDAAALLTEFGAKLKAAGQDKIVAEAQAQANAYLVDRK